MPCYSQTDTPEDWVVVLPSKVTERTTTTYCHPFSKVTLATLRRTTVGTTLYKLQGDLPYENSGSGVLALDCAARPRALGECEASSYGKGEVLPPSRSNG